ncbi:MAG: DinB family protein [Rhizobiaceae bacterium]
MKSHFTMFAAYNAWANSVLYAAAAKLPDEDYRLDRGAPFKSLHGTLNHILVADRIWMKRFTGDGDAPAKLDTILYDDRALLGIAREAEDARVTAWINDLRPEAFTGRFTYTTVTDLRTISQRLAPALAHFFNHQTHHRGQASAILTAFGEEAPQMDLIYFQRSKEGRRFA